MCTFIPCPLAVRLGHASTMTDSSTCILHVSSLPCISLDHWSFLVYVRVVRVWASDQPQTCALSVPSYMLYCL